MAKNKKYSASETKKEYEYPFIGEDKAHKLFDNGKGLSDLMGYFRSQIEPINNTVINHQFEYWKKLFYYQNKEWKQPFTCWLNRFLQSESDLYWRTIFDRKRRELRDQLDEKGRPVKAELIAEREADKFVKEFKDYIKDNY